MERPLAELAEEIAKINRSKGWRRLYTDVGDVWADDHRIPTGLALLHTEVSEAMEAFREDDREGFGEELADVLIRLLDLAKGCKVDLDVEVLAKMAKNRKRPHRHGGKRV